MSKQASTSDWSLVAGSPQDIDALRRKCRRMVLRRAALSTGVSALPLSGLDLATDLGLLASLIEDINREFGLTPAQIERLNPRMRLVTYQIIIGMGGVMVGKMITRELVLGLLKKAGMKMLAKHSARIVPLAGQAVAAALGFATFRTIGYQHVEACAAVLESLASQS